MQKYIYNVNYQTNDEPLCSIELRALFNKTLTNKVFFSDVEINPSISPFIKNRLEVLYETESYDDLLHHVENDDSRIKDFLVSYVELEENDPYLSKSKNICKEVGFRFKEYVNFESPNVIYGVSFYSDKWYFGVLVKNNNKWLDHNNRPFTYSHSLKLNMAKTLVNIASRGDRSLKLIDPCCGAGTVLLEACFGRYTIVGSDMNYKMTQSSQKNLAHFGYHTKIVHQKIEDITDAYDSVIVDLPYGLFSSITLEEQISIIRNAKRIAERVVIVSSEDITELLGLEKLEIVDQCKVIKTVNRDFARYIWVCKSM